MDFPPHAPHGWYQGHGAGDSDLWQQLEMDHIQKESKIILGRTWGILLSVGFGSDHTLFCAARFQSIWYGYWLLLLLCTFPKSAVNRPSHKKVPVTRVGKGGTDGVLKLVILQYMPRYIAPLALSSKAKAVVAQDVRISDAVCHSVQVLWSSWIETAAQASWPSRITQRLKLP